MILDRTELHRLVGNKEGRKIVQIWNLAAKQSKSAWLQSPLEKQKGICNVSPVIGRHCKLWDRPGYRSILRDWSAVRAGLAMKEGEVICFW